MSTIYDEFRVALHSIWHRRWLALGVAWGVCLLGWLAVALVPNSYESRARIFVQLDDALAEQIGIGAGDRKRDIERVQQTLTSAVNLGKIVRSTRIGESVTTPKQMETAVLALAKSVKVVSTQDNLFEISAISRNSSYSDTQNAQLAKDIVQKIIDIFRDENLKGGQGQMTETLDFMNTQLADRQKQLEAAEQARLAFESRNPELAQGGTSVLQRLEGSRAELRGIDADLAAAQSALAAINGQLAGTPATLPGVGVSGGPRGALSQAMSDLAAMHARGMTDSHPDVVSQKNQIASLRAQVQAEAPGTVSGQPNPAYSSLQSIKAERQANVQALISRHGSVQSDLAQISAKQFGDPTIAAEAQRISRDYDVLKQQYDKLLLDREELRLRGQVETERSSVKFEVTDPPTSPRSPIAPNRPLLLLGVLVVGIGAGIGAAFGLGQLRSTFTTAGKLEGALGLPVLGTISHTLTHAGRVIRARRMRYWIAGTAALGGLFVLLLVVEVIQVGMVA